MRFFKDIDEERFGLFETRTTDGKSCPTCGRSTLSTLDTRMKLIEGQREDEANWVVLDDRLVPASTSFEEFLRQVEIWQRVPIILGKRP